MWFRRRHSENSLELELELRESRPRPSTALESRVLEQLTDREPVAHRARRRSGGLIVAFAIVATALLASFGGIGYAASSTVEAASSTVSTVTGQTVAVVKVVKRAVKPAKNDKPKVVTSSPASDQYKPDKVTICHRTGSGSVTITVSRSALPAHLAHGDTMGACSS